ncbi:MAG: quinone-dependent dihydroorotate dehydrogenase [Bacteroidales bacterium]|nr:quinone-dependent dihydroorotate dehydrogenase [Bacteroidales bacterium]
MFYKKIIRPLLFSFNPEIAHSITFALIKFPGINFILKKLYNIENEKLIFSKNNFNVKNRIGLAAGLDKDAEAVKQFASIGFGFVEIGTVTPLPQPGNNKPRLFRLKKNNALINRMGFNNLGAENMKKKLLNKKFNTLVGINLGKNKITPLPQAYSDYVKSFELLFNEGDYFVINVSSPNTPNLRQLQDKEFLNKILAETQKINQSKPKPKPLFLKIAPDLSYKQIDEIIQLIDYHNLSGIIATNTTISRQSLDYSESFINEIGAGGLSGKPLKEKSTEIIRYIKSKSSKDLIIIGVGGIFSFEDVVEKIEAGADLIQIYTSFIYEGPAIVQRINKQLIKYFSTKKTS